MKIFLILALILLGGYFYFGYFLDINKTGLSGIVSKSGEYWRIESDAWYRPVRAIVNNLPKEYQKEGLFVSCDVVVVDVIGTGEWDTYAEVSNCK